jgi:hypothetical protein
LKIPFPQFGTETADEASALADVGLSIIDSSFYVLGGQGMKIVIKQELEEHVVNLLKTIQEINCF